MTAWKLVFVKLRLQGLIQQGGSGMPDPYVTENEILAVGARHASPVLRSTTPKVKYSHGHSTRARPQSRVARPELKPRHQKVPVKAEYSPDAPTPHEGKRNTVGEAHFLISELLKKLQRFQLFFLPRSQDLKLLRSEQLPRPLRRKSVRRPTRKQGCRLVYNVVTRKQAPTRFSKSCPSDPGLVVVLIRG